MFYSFYGGRPGNSFVIITAYKSVADMVAKFKQGPNYNIVHYDEYVIINTVNKNDPDNGKIYRRGYNFTNDMGGAIYIGTIVGPAGKAPMLEMTTIADVETKHAQEGFDERKNSGQYSLTNGNLVPGKIDNETFNDAITWKSCSIRNENDEDCTAYIGFTIPYMVIDYETQSVDPYDSDTGQYTDTTSATRVDDGTHPFFEKWQLNIPKGVKGSSFMNFKAEPASSLVEEYPGKADDIANNRMILAYDYYKYDNHQDGEPVRLYLGDYNTINNISMNDEGTITIDYSHNDDSIMTKKVKWISSIALNTETGLFTVTYNHTTDASGNPTTYTTYLDWIKEVNVADDGTVTFEHTHGNDTVLDKKIKWCTNATINQNGTVTFTWNNGSQDTVFQNLIKWIQSINMTADGTLRVEYNNGASPSIFQNAIKWITNVNLADDGTLQIDFNNNSESYVASQKIKWINDISLAQDGTVTVSYNNESPNTVFANKIKWLTGATLSNNGTFKLDWNDGSPSTTYANLIKWIQSISIGTDGTVTLIWNNGSENTVYNQLIKWISNCKINTGLGEGSGNQKLNITWNDGTSQDIGNPINYIMGMKVTKDNHLLVRYSDPNRRATGMTYEGVDGWTDLGQIHQRYVYSDGDSALVNEWMGLGELIDDGTNHKKLRFIMNLNTPIDEAVEEITVESGQLKGGNSVDTISGLNLTPAVVSNTAAGLQFEIDSGIASSGSQSISFVNLLINDLTLEFSYLTLDPEEGGEIIFPV